jgi:hypothetical protein
LSKKKKQKRRSTPFISFFHQKILNFRSDFEAETFVQGHDNGSSQADNLFIFIKVSNQTDQLREEKMDSPPLSTNDDLLSYNLDQLELLYSPNDLLLLEPEPYSPIGLLLLGPEPDPLMDCVTLIRPLAPFQSSGHIIRDNEYGWIEISLPLVTKSGKWIVATFLDDEQDIQICELEAIPESLCVVLSTEKKKAVLKVKLPNLGHNSQILKLRIQIYLESNGIMNQVAESSFPFQRYTGHSKFLPEEEVKRRASVKKRKKEEKLTRANKPPRICTQI